MNRGNSSGGGLIAIILGAVAAVLMATGAFGSIHGVAGSILRFIGIGSIIVASLLIAVVIAIIVIAIVSNKKDTFGDEKKEVREWLEEQRKEIAKLKSNISVKKMELRRAENSGQTELAARLRDTIAHMEEQCELLQSEQLAAKVRHDDAVSMINEAENMTKQSPKLTDLEEKAQHEKDYADALKQLGGL